MPEQGGIRYKIKKGITVDEARAHAEALAVVGDVYEGLHFYCDGRAGSPKKAELKEALSALFERLVRGEVTEDQASEWVQRRIGMGGAGCLAVLAFLLPLASVAILVVGAVG